MAHELRKGYHQRLDALREEATAMATQVVLAVRHATDALLEGDLAITRDLIEADPTFDTRSRDVEREILDLLALQAPVARELRFLLATQRIAQELQLSGHLATSIARRVGAIHPEVLSPETRVILYEMGAAGAELTHTAIGAYALAEPAAAREVLARDDHVAELQRRLLRELFAIGEARDVGPVVELGLIARFYGRIADHALVVAERAIFVDSPDEGTR
jgi:phosphate transport system protein